MILRASSVRLELVFEMEIFSVEFAGLRDSVEAEDPLTFLFFLKEGGRKASMAILASPTSLPGRWRYSSMSVTRIREVATR